MCKEIVPVGVVQVQADAAERLGGEGHLRKGLASSGSGLGYGRPNGPGATRGMCGELIREDPEAKETKAAPPTLSRRRRTRRAKG
jgi:hypothetical protein